MEEAKSISIVIKEINELSFKLNHPQIPVEELIIGENLVISIAYCYDADLDSNLFNLLTKIKYEIKDEEDPCLELEVEIKYEVSNLSEVIKKLNGNLKIKDDFLVAITGVGIGTTRGILASNVKGNQMSKFPLPILNPKEILDKMKESDLNI